MNLSSDQTKELKAQEWDVKPTGIKVTVYKKDFADDYTGWLNICKIANVRPVLNEVTFLSFGVISK